MKFQEIVKQHRGQQEKHQQQVNPAYDYNRIGIPTKDGVTMVFCADILRCEANKAHCVFYLVNGEMMPVKKHLGYYEEKLMEWNFFKIHKSHLVNMQHVADYVDDKESYVVLSDHSKVPVSVRRRNLLMKRVKFAAAHLSLREKMERQAD